MNPVVNRYLEDKPMDRIDHALGRSLDPLTETYRNYFCVGKSDAVAGQMKSSPLWSFQRRIGDQLFFAVTAKGRQVLSDHLKSIGDPHGAYTVTIHGETGAPFAAKSLSRARYSAWLNWFSDQGMTFGEFCRVAKVRSVGAAGCV